MDVSGNKGFRLLDIFERLNRGEEISKSMLATAYEVTEKTVQRDIDDLRAYLAETHMFEKEASIQYNRKKNRYYLVRLQREFLTNEEVLAMSKVLLESRAFCKEELDGMLSKLVMQTTPKNQAQVVSLLENERFHYIPPRHNQKLLHSIWELSTFIRGKEIISISYKRKDGTAREHNIKPVAIMFSEYYFYLIAFMADKKKDFPTVFRIDRISDCKGTKEKFYVPYRDEFSEGEFRKRVQFMFSGELRKVTFIYRGQSIEAVLDRLPTAEILSVTDGVYTVKVEVYGNGIDMWLRSQGDMVEVIK